MNIYPLDKTNSYIPYINNYDYNSWKEKNNTLITSELIYQILYAKNTQINFERKLCLIKGMTGSGKSTKLLTTLLEKYPKKNILCTEPRKLLCYNNSTALDEMFNHKLGETVGFMTGDSKVFPNKPGILYLTIEILNQKFNQNISLNSFSYIVIDEVHELSYETLFALYYIKIYIHKHYQNKNCPTFILQSATLDEKLLASYFNLNLNNPLNYIIIEGTKPFNVMNHFITKNDSLLISMTYSLKTFAIPYILDTKYNENYYDNILIIVNSGMVIHKYIYESIKIIDKTKFEIFTVENYSLESLNSKKINIVIFEINSTNTSIKLSKENLILKEDRPNLFKIIFASSISEAGFTLNNLGVCIDSGFIKNSYARPFEEKKQIILHSISYNSYIQRYGRVGRRKEGMFIGLYKENVLNKLMQNYYPKIYFDIDFTYYYLQIFINSLNNNKLLFNKDLIYKLNFDMILNIIQTGNKNRCINSYGYIVDQKKVILNKFIMSLGYNSFTSCILYNLVYSLLYEYNNNIIYTLFEYTIKDPIKLINFNRNKINILSYIEHIIEICENFKINQLLKIKETNPLMYVQLLSILSNSIFTMKHTNFKSYFLYNTSPINKKIINIWSNYII